MSRRGVALALAATLAVAGCGRQDMSGSAAETLRGRVASITAAVEAGAAETAGMRLRALRRAVEELLEAGEITQGRAARILAAADEVAASLALLPDPLPEPTSEPTAEPTAEPTEPPPTDEEGEEEKDKDKDKDKEEEGEGEDD